MKNLAVYRNYNILQAGLGGIALIASIAMTTIDSMGIVLVALSIMAIISRGGYEFDNETNLYRDFSTYFFVKVGKWKSLKAYTGVIITPVRVGQRINSRTSSVSITSKEAAMKVMLVNKTHLKKQQVFISMGKQSAIEACTSISKHLSLPIVKYNPQISEATKSRKR